jgi:hypothetical protein
LVVLAFIGHAASQHRIVFVSNLEAIIYDVRLRLTMPGSAVIVDIDEKIWRRRALALAP